jgi:hypothetical protein
MDSRFRENDEIACFRENTSLAGVFAAYADIKNIAKTPIFSQHFTRKIRQP